MVLGFRGGDAGNVRPFSHGRLLWCIRMAEVTLLSDGWAVCG